MKYILLIVMTIGSIAAFAGDVTDTLQDEYTGVSLTIASQTLIEINPLIPKGSAILSVDFQNANKIRVKTATTTEPLAGRGSILTIQKIDGVWTIVKEMNWRS